MSRTTTLGDFDVVTGPPWAFSPRAYSLGPLRPASLPRPAVPTQPAAPERPAADHAAGDADRRDRQ